MKMRTLGTLPAVAALLLSGCTSGVVAVNPTPIAANPPGAGAATTAQPAPTTAAPTPTIETNARGNVVKQVGELAGVTNPETGAQVVSFKVTGIQPNFKCTNKYASKSENGNFIAITLDVTASRELADADYSSFSVNPAMWKVIGPDGTTENASTSGAGYGCAKNSEQIPGSVKAGEHVVGVVILDSKHTSGAVSLQPLGVKSGWEWNFGS